MRYLVDSDWLIDATGGRSSAVNVLARLSADGLAVSIVAVAEIYEGAFGATDPVAALADFRQFLRDYAILPLNDSIAVRFAGLRVQLRPKGLLIPDMDLFIAATALNHDLTLLTRNVRHFARVPHLRLYQPT